MVLTRMKYVIIGNGILGFSVAYGLLDFLGSGDKVVIIGSFERIGSATLAAGAMLNSFAELEAGSLDTAVDRARFALSRRATALWPSYLQSIAQRHSSGSGELLSPTTTNIGRGAGTYIINNCAADTLDDHNFDAIISALEEYGEPHTVVSPSEIPNFAPEERFRALRAVHLELEGWVNPRALMDILGDLLTGHPAVTLVDASAVSLHRVGHTIVRCDLSTGETVEGDAFVVATGASTSRLLEQSQLGIAVQKLFYGVGATIEIDPHDQVPSACIRTPNRGLACGVYAIPSLAYRKGDKTHLMIGASNFISPAPYPRVRLASLDVLTTAASSQINQSFYRADFIRMNVGWRPTSTDTYPLVGRSSIANLIFCTGTKRDGFHLSPLISRHIVGLLLGSHAEDGWDDFAPERQPIRSMSRSQGIEKAVAHQISAAYQHGFQPPHGRLINTTVQALRDDAERVHDLAGAYDWGIPPEMLDMYRYGHITN